MAALDAVYINMSHRSDRRATMERGLREAGLVAARVEATTGAAAADNLVGRDWDTKLNARFDRNCKVERLRMSDGERGCAASHAKLWRRCVESGAPLLVLEVTDVTDVTDVAATRAGGA